MKLRLFLFLLFCSSLFSQEILLKNKDIKETMNKLFVLHIDQKKISTQILERSLKIYLTQFDPAHAYLLKDEVMPYVHPTTKFLKNMEIEYNKSIFTTYYSLDHLIQESIIRAREWRLQWAQNPKKLFLNAQKIKEIKPTPRDNSYVLTKNELENRHYDRFLRFMALQLDENQSYSGKESQLVALCEKQLRMIENQYLGINDKFHPLSGESQEHLMTLRTLKALANSLDAHTAYYSPEEAYAMKVQLEKGMCGIGVVLREGINGIVIQDVVKDSPAARSGYIQKGDMLVEIDGQNVRDFSFQKILEMMRGKTGSIVQLGIIHRNGSMVRIELIRGNIMIDDKRVDIDSEPYKNGYIGKIKLHSFYESENGISSEADIKDAIQNLRSNGRLHGLILDLRDNGGGFLSQAVKVSGIFISNGVVVISKYSDGTIKYYRTIGGKKYYDGPLVVLISRGSASATEIVAQTLQEYGVAIVVGDDQTYGKGTIQHQTITNSSGNSFFKVTVGRYYTVSGRSTQISGVKSDIVIPSELQFEQIGEAYLDYPLPADSVDPAFEDSLSDIDPIAKKWFQKYYLSDLQPIEYRWSSLVKTLDIKSKKRLEQNKNFQLFLKQANDSERVSESFSHDIDDWQMEEAINILKDMISLSNAK